MALLSHSYKALVKLGQGEGAKLFEGELYTGLERLDRDKHSSLLQKFVNYGQKSFYNIGPRSQTAELSPASLLSWRRYFRLERCRPWRCGPPPGSAGRGRSCEPCREWRDPPPRRISRLPKISAGVSVKRRSHRWDCCCRKMAIWKRLKKSQCNATAELLNACG